MEITVNGIMEKTGKASDGGGQGWNAGMYILAYESLKKKTKRNMVSETCFSVGSVAEMKQDWAGTHELWERHQEAH